MRLAARQKGFTLLGFILTISLVISVIAGAGVYMVEKFGESGATQLGVRMAEYNGAVGRYIQENVATITSNASYSGIAWLQNTSCGGGAVSDYLPCTYPSSLPFNLAYQTAITVSGSDITATVTYGPGSLQFRGKWRLDFAESAKNKAVENQMGGLRLSQNFVVTASNVLQSTVSTVGASEPWLRIDGSNSPIADIDWDNNSITNLDCIDFGDGRICSDGAGKITMSSSNGVTASNSVTTTDVYANRMIDLNNSTYQSDPSGTSRLNYVDANVLRLRNDYTAGASCTTEQVGTTSNGTLLSCVNGIWEQPGAVVQMARGTVGYDGYVAPIAGYTRAQCIIALSGVPYKNDGGYKRSRHYSYYYVNSGAGWRLRAGSRAISDNQLHGVSNAVIQYQLVCSR